MPLNPDWTDIGFRLACCFIACTVIGLDREWQERAAGMRTTILVGLAACFAAISANLLLSTFGKENGDFAQIDVMRLPLGILTGIGFIGAGAIVRRDNGLVHGVTTAATLWFVTVMGLSFGLGQLALGGIAFSLALVTLWGLKHAELYLHKRKEATLALTLSRDGPSEDQLTAMMKDSGVHIRRMFVRHEPLSGRRDYRFSLWSTATAGASPPLVGKLRELTGVEQIDWEI